MENCLRHGGGGMGGLGIAPCNGRFYEKLVALLCCARNADALIRRRSDQDLIVYIRPTCDKLGRFFATDNYIDF